MRLILEDSDSGHSAAATAREGSIASVQEAISNFNDVDRSMLTLTNTVSKTVLGICGKPSALIVTWQHDHNDPPYMTMCADQPIGGRVLLLCGQLADYDGEIVVTRREADDALEHFIATGQMTPLHRWREE